MAGQIFRSPADLFKPKPVPPPGQIMPGQLPVQQPATNNPLANDALTNQYKLYNSAVQQNAGDYDSIMKQYQNLANARAPQKLTTNQYLPATANEPNKIDTSGYTAKTYNPMSYQAQISAAAGSGGSGGSSSSSGSSTYNPTQMAMPGTITPERMTAELSQYKQSPDSIAAIANLKELAGSGGYSDQGIADLRARGISPIRAVYANAQRNVDRQRSLQGGFSPNYNAVTSKMAREMSDQIANQTTNVNAGIAQNVASNRLQIAPSYNAAAAGQSDLANQMGQHNVDAQNAAGQFNANAGNAAQLQNIANIMAANQFNAGAANNAGQFNAQQNQQNQQFGAGQNQQNNQFNAGALTNANANNAQAFNAAGAANAGAQNDANRFTVGAQNAANQQNVQNQIGNQQFNAGNRNDASRFNIGNVNATNQQNIANQQNARDAQLRAVQGQQGLYGTTPAMAQLFGSQAQRAAELQNQINQQNKNNAMNFAGQAWRY